MEKSRINPISDKQREKNKLWKAIADRKAFDLNYKCQWCGGYGSRVLDEPWIHLDGHHIIKRRYNIHTYENCYIAHNQPCHLSEIEENNVDVGQYPNKEAWEVKE